MDLYFYNSPKKQKRAFSFPFLKRRSSTEQRLTQKRKFSAASVTDFFQKKISAFPTKKFKSQIFPSKNNSNNDCLPIIDDGIKDLEVLTHPLSPVPPPAVPQKEETIPDLRIDEDYLLYRALPSLPQEDPVLIMDERKEAETKTKRRWMKVHREEKSTSEKERSNRTTTSGRIISNLFSKKMTLHCKILQLSIPNSNQSFEYTLQLHVTNNQSHTCTGIMKQIAQGTSAAHPEMSLLFKVKDNFQFTCELSLKPCSRLAPFRKRENPQLTFAKGIKRYSIQTSTSEIVEIAIAFWLEEHDEQPGKKSTPPERDVQRYCQMGDYLTFYEAEGDSKPKWKRYWVTYRLNNLLLKDNEVGGDIIDKIPLTNVSQVSVNPSGGIEEDACSRKNYMLELTIDESTISLCCDSSKSLCYWKCLFETHMEKSTCGI